MKQNDFIDVYLSNHKEALKSVEKNRDILLKIANVSYESMINGGKLVFFGNGGSAAQAQHFAAELVVSYDSNSRKIRGGLPAIALTTDSSILTAAGNDLGFDAIFERQIEALAKPRDVVIGISTSWNSSNVKTAIKRAKDLGAITVGFAGNQTKKEYIDYWLNVDSDYVGNVQEVHLIFGHLLCSLIDEIYGGIENDKI